MSKSGALLRRNDTVVVEAHNSLFYWPRLFYWNRPGLRIDPSAKKFLVGSNRKVWGLPSCSMTSFDLIRIARDSEIQSSLPAGHVFQNPCTFSAYLAGMIRRQRGASLGPELRDVERNLFYVRDGSDVWVVSALAIEYLKAWQLQTYRTGRRKGWFTGSRIHVPAACPV